MGGDPIRDELTSSVADGWMPGATWWVEGPGGRVSSGAVGLAAVAPQRRPAAEEIPYDLSSLTKPLATALVALLMEQEGLVDLEAPIAHYLDEFAGGPYERVRLIDLAAHRGGFPAWRALYLGATDIGGYLRQIAETPPAVDAGKPLYTDLGYIVLGAILERVDGERLDRVFDRRVARPLGLQRAGYAGPLRRFTDAAATERGNLYEREMVGDAGAGNCWRNEVLVGEVHDGNAFGLGGVAGHAGLFATAEEVAAIAREILKPRRLPLRPANSRRMLSRVPGSDDRTFGFVVARQTPAARGVLPAEAPGHTGFTGTSLWIDPAGGRLYVLLTNRVHPKVQLRGLQPVRLRFHRAAAALLDGRSV